MQIVLKPQVKSLIIERQCPSGKIVIRGTVSYYSPGGMELATKELGGYGGLDIEFSDDTLSKAKLFVDAVLGDVEGVITQSLKENLEI